MNSRRDFLKNGLAFSLVGTSGPVFKQELSTETLELKQIEIESPSISPEFEGYRIAFISDLHAGVFLSENLLNETVNLINSANPNLLILGGDYVGVPDNKLAKLSKSLHSSNLIFKNDYKNTEKILNYLGNSLSRIKTEDGILAVMGNHDHWNNATICLKTLSNFGIKFLINESFVVRRASSKLLIFGTDDYWTGIPKISGDFIKNVDSNLKILVSHNPDFIAETISQNKSDFNLALCGHTHGGQICINGIGAIAGYNIRHQELAYGLVKNRHQTIYTSRGIGVVDIPLRLNCKPEVTIFKLKA